MNNVMIDIPGRLHSVATEKIIAGANEIYDDNLGKTQEELNEEFSNNASSISITITYDELKSLRDTNKLVPGQWYRITDYVCTTSQANTQAAGNQFDIIVRADTTNKINENAYATHHEGDTYFENSNLSAWELKYDLNNNTTKYAWASSNGKGVIYYMKDEWGNEAPYDFKNIMFARYWVTSSRKGNDWGLVNKFSAYNDLTNTSILPNDVTASGTPNYCYTFTKLSDSTSSATVMDYSNIANNEYCYGNKIGLLKSAGKFYLNNIVIIAINTTDQEHTNVFAANCRNITLYNGNTGNVFGSNNYNMTFGNYCSSNSFGNQCASNSFGNSCSSNSFGNGCSSNSFGNRCSANSFGNNFYSNSFGDGCSSNSFGNQCSSNSFGNSCPNNSFMDFCQDNSFGNYCQSNSFGNYCFYNSFMDNCYYNSFGNYITRISFSKVYTYYIIVENGNGYITITSTNTTNNSNKLRNITIAQGVNNTSTVKTISHNTVNDTFRTVYQSTGSTVVNV